ncbi:MAG: Gfo/Idh/MocA family oxidoreductase, partial [Alphaproteobacteria bacterium]|nr:Gfo/Idh/MocA family oxidoreductase [Alphaproteobacteria bacterium]
MAIGSAGVYNRGSNASGEGSMVRAAIIGIGRWGRTLIGGVQGKSDKFRFVAGHNRTRANAEAFCAEHGVPLKDSLDEILADPAIDAVVFATPHSEHGPQVERAAAAGKHVFMEKPFTLDRASAARALDAVARAGVVLGVAYPRRFHPGMRELKARIDDGRLGTIAHCYAEQNAPAGLFMDPRSWRAESAEAPAGGMTALGVHNLDAMVHLFGPIEEVYARSIRRTIAYDAEDTTSVMMQFANGMSGTLVCSLVTAVSYRLAAFGSKGCGELVTPELEFRFTPTPAGMPTGRHAQPEPEIIQSRHFNALKAELEAFADAIGGGAP